MIRSMIREQGVDQGIEVSGAMMLPYFSYPSGEDENEVVLSDAFLEQAQGALMYYARLFEQENVFDSVYAIGWHPLIQLKYFQKGGDAQSNPPLIPELYAALAAVDFFSANESNAPGGVLLAGRSEGGKVGWNDLPSVGGVSIQDRLGQLTRFCWAYHYIYAGPIRSDETAINRESWCRRLIGRQNIKLSEPRIKHVLEDLDEFCTTFLSWIANLTYASNSEALDVDLTACRHFSELSKDDPQRPAKLLIQPRSKDRRAFSRLVSGTKGPALNKVFEYLTYAEINREHAGLGTFVGTLYEACSLED